MRNLVALFRHREASAKSSSQGGSPVKPIGLKVNIVMDELGPQHLTSHPASHDLGYEHDRLTRLPTFKNLFPCKKDMPLISCHHHPQHIHIEGQGERDCQGVTCVPWPTLSCPVLLWVTPAKWPEVRVMRAETKSTATGKSLLTLDFPQPRASEHLDTAGEHLVLFQCFLSSELTRWLTLECGCLALSSVGVYHQRSKVSFLRFHYVDSFIQSNLVVSETGKQTRRPLHDSSCSTSSCKAQWAPMTQEVTCTLVASASNATPDRNTS